MYVKKLVIENYKIFKRFNISFNKDINIIVGNNNAGKSTILEALHLVLSGVINGSYIKNSLSTYLFNQDITKEYLDSLKGMSHQPPPYILIEAYLDEEKLALFSGSNNSNREQACGISFKIEFDELFKEEYDNLDKSRLSSIPIEYYKVTWSNFADTGIITARSIPLKSILIDSSSNKYRNGSDIYISKIIKEYLNSKQNASLAQSYRQLKEAFKEDDAIHGINNCINDAIDSPLNNLSISVDMSAKNAWENQLKTFLADIPFEQIGKGEQCIIKTLLAITQDKKEECNLILLEEPENHLSYSKLNSLIKTIQEKSLGKQIILSTHSSFVANKMNLSKLILLHNSSTFIFNSLTEDTYDFFMKSAGYDTLRFILSKKCILVEGKSDELIIQRAYLDKYGKLPIEDEIDIITLESLSFKRYLEIAKVLKNPINILTDNDGNYEKNIAKKYLAFKDYSNIEITSDKNDSLNTLEPQLIDANKNIKDSFHEIIEWNSQKGNIYNYMKKNKANIALNIFKSKKKILYPEYIKNAINWSHEDKQ